MFAQIKLHCCHFYYLIYWIWRKKRQITDSLTNLQPRDASVAHLKDPNQVHQPSNLFVCRLRWWVRGGGGLGRSFLDESDFWDSYSMCEWIRLQKKMTLAINVHMYGDILRQKLRGQFYYFPLDKFYSFLNSQ